MYSEHLVSYKVALERAKSLFYANIISNGQSNTRTVFSTVNKLLKPHNVVSLPPIQCVSYSTFLNSKIDSIHHELLNSVYCLVIMKMDIIIFVGQQVLCQILSCLQ